MSIFGTQEPRFIGSNGTTVDLDNARVLRNQPEYDTIINQSKLSGDRTVITRFRDWVFEVQIHLNKYGALAENKFNNLDSYLYDKVTLYRHRDGNAFDSPFKFVSIMTFYLEKINYKDAAILTFISNTNLTLGLQPIRYLKTPEDDFITTPDGKKIIVPF